MPWFLHRVAHALFGSKPVVEEPADASSAYTRPSRGSASPSRASSSREHAFEPIDSNASTRDWFEGMPSSQTVPSYIRDSIASDPDSARWFRKPRYVVRGDALHRPSGIGAGSK